MDTVTKHYDRRTFLRLVVLGAGSLVAGTWPLRAAAKQPPIDPAEGGAALVPVDDDAGRLPAPGRYLFRGATRRGIIAETLRLEAFWALPQYVRLVDCSVSYTGEPPLVLTAEEDAVVQVAVDAGAVVTDRGAYYLTVVAACTRIPPNEVNDRLTALGVPGVTAALVVAPSGPQANRFRRWLAQQLR
jgi:hypothetical protein